jgi:phage tail protein X
MAEYYEYITKEGDRWDLIAYQYYGDATMYETIIAANPDVAIMPILPSGIKLKAPVIDMKETIPSEELPPWKQ